MAFLVYTVKEVENTGSDSPDKDTGSLDYSMLAF